MKSIVITPESTSTPQAKKVRKQWFHLAFVITLGLSAVHPARAQTLTVLYSFAGGADGWSPSANVALDARGNLYGTTSLGGDLTCDSGSGCGAIFKLDSHGRKTILHTFRGGADGAYPGGGVLRDAAGNLYGTTKAAGDLTCNSGNGCGTVFKLDAHGGFTVLHAFTGVPDGLEPEISPLLRDSQGNIYGTTEQGGDENCENSAGCGTVFKVDGSGKETVLHVFHGGTDGAYPLGGVIRDAAGNIFGTTSAGGTFRGGVVYKVDAIGNETVLYNFAGTPDGLAPWSTLVAVGEYLYGTTSTGGSFGFGTLFKVDKAAHETVVYNFAGLDGNFPVEGLTRDGNGILYGTTLYGGGYVGNVFKLDTSTGAESVVYDFTGGTDGAYPGGFFKDAAGNLYGATESGGAYGFGSIFKITP